MATWVLILACIVCFSMWGVAESRAIKSSDALTVQLISAYVYSAFAPVFYLYARASSTPITWSIASVGWSTACCLLSVFAGFAFAAALQRATVGTIVSLTSVYPVVTFIFCWLVLGEPVTVLKAMGIVTVVVGTVLVSL